MPGKGQGCVSWSGSLATTKDNFGIRADATSRRYQVLCPFDPEFDLEGQTPNQRSCLCKLPREASYHLGRFWYTYWRNCGTICGTPSFDPEFDLNSQMPVRDHGCVSCSGRLAVAWDHFDTRADVTSGRYQEPRPLTLNLTLKVKCNVKSHWCLSAEGGYMSFKTIFLHALR